MRNIHHIYNHQDCYDIWHQFRFGDCQVSDIKSHIDPIILASWQRCEDIFTSTLANPSTHQQREQYNTKVTQHAKLISVAVPYMEDIDQFIEGVAIAVLLTDKDGVILTIEMDMLDAKSLRKIGLTTGSQWSENMIGTNAIGLSLITAMPTQVVGAEHYLQIYHPYSESAAPIHDEYGAIIGTIAILTTTDQANPSQLALVMATAYAISNQLQSNLLLEQANRRLRQMDSILESMVDGVITWNTDLTIEHINSMACQIIGIHNSSLLGKPLHEVIKLPEYIQSAISEHRDLSDVETRIRINDRIIKCLVIVRTIYSGTNDIMGGIAMLRPLSQVRSLVHQQTTASPSITFEDFHSESKVMQAIIRQAKTAAKGSVGVFLIGEGGVGKTVLAQAIHNASPRASKPFVVVNCGMVPTEFMVEELLGKESRDNQLGRPSKFELADGGTLLFDMIDQLSLQAQQILLNVVNSRHVNRIYATQATAVNVRIIATTSQNIEKLIETNSFLPQLYYLFNAFRLYIPPLRERRIDITSLARYFLDRVAKATNIHYQFEPEALKSLQNYPWPGNVRELESLIERVVIHASDHLIRVSDLPHNIQTAHGFVPGLPIPQPAISLVDAEYKAIMRAGWACEGVISNMADVLGINRSTLWRKLKQHGISANDFKSSTR